MLTPTDERDWIFTFGYGHEHPEYGKLGQRYVRIHGTWIEARLAMIDRFGKKWGFQYESEAAAGVDRFGLVELPL